MHRCDGDNAALFPSVAQDSLFYALLSLVTSDTTVISGKPCYLLLLYSSFAIWFLLVWWRGIQRRIKTVCGFLNQKETKHHMYVGGGQKIRKLEAI